MNTPTKSPEPADTADAAGPARPVGTVHAGRGRLLRKILAIFVAGTAIAVVLNCLFTFLNAKNALLAYGADRLNQVTAYAAGSVALNNIDDLASAWEEYGLDPDPSMTYSLAFKEVSALDDAYNELVNEATSSGGAISDEDRAQLEQLSEQAERAYYEALYYSLAEMLDRLRASFSCDRLMIASADPQAHELTVIACGVEAGQPRGSEGAPAYGTVEARPAEDYPLLWGAVSGNPSTELEFSPDSSSYSAYSTLSVNDQVWVVEMTIDSDELFAKALGQTASTMLVTCVVFALCIAAILAALGRLLVSPLTRLGQHVSEFASSKSSAVARTIRAERYPRDEVGDLAANVANMVDEIQAHIDDVTRLGAERERAKAELAVANRIQLAALPSVRPPFTGNGEFGLAASMNPAKEVGGDFYDFFMVSENTCAVMIADVSGKGVPAALFMMRAKALLNQLTRDGLDPSTVLTRANENLCSDNTAGMFVTVWLGLLNQTTGELVYANGGHNPPVLSHASDGSAEWLKERSGLLLGSFDGIRYKSFSRTMQPGDSLVLYTDGVTEAMDVDDRCYGNERLLSLVKSSASCGPQDMAENIRTDVQSFSSGAEQADDITLLVLHFDGGTFGGASVAGKRG